MVTTFSETHAFREKKKEYKIKIQTKEYEPSDMIRQTCFSHTTQVIFSKYLP